MKKILIINSNYYKNISKNLVSSSKKKLETAKFKTNILNVPGVYEIPIAIRKNIKKFDGFVALGCVIKGKTPHFDLICSSTFLALMTLSINFNKPIGNGIITALNLNQAKQRSKKSNLKKPNKGLEAANAVISILKNGPKKI
jgi:6,7-dimethyl-8-ribityllumazine synthase